jgi:hypothetical protein
MNPKTEQRPVERDYEQYDQVYQRTPNSFILYIAIPLMLFGLLCFVWALPFPHLAFLGRYNGYVNWASFLIAGLIYHYLKLSPIVSYLILFMFFGFSYGIIQLEQWQKAGGPSLWLTGIVILLAGIVGQIVLLKVANANRVLHLVPKSATWLCVSILKKAKLKY